MSVARNALFLYLRTIVTMVVGIFSVRIMLEVLGQDDYGLSNVAGASLGMFTFVLAGMSTSSSRFITYELGRGDMKRLSDTFATTFTVFAIMAGVILLLGETIGLWVISRELNIPEGRETAAMVVYQCALFGVVLGTISTPYGSVMVAHERFDVSATISLVSSFAKLGLLYALRGADTDRLIVYSLLLLGITVLSTAIIIWFCLRHYGESRPRLRICRTEMMPILKFSGWEVTGSFSRMLKFSLFPVVVNILYGVGVNTAIGIALTVSGAVTGLAYTISSAFKPHILKKFAAGDIAGMTGSTCVSTLLSMVLYGIFALPLIANLGFVMKLWLGEVPPMAGEMCLTLLFINFFSMASVVPGETLKSMGHNMMVNLILAGNALMSFLFLGIAAAFGASPVVSYSAFQCGLIVFFVGAIYLYGRILGMKALSELLKTGIASVSVAIILTGACIWAIGLLLEPGFIKLALSCLLSVVMFAALSYKWLFPPYVRIAMKTVATAWIKRIAAPLSSSSSSQMS